ncbi:MAG: replicative DNA helicase [Ignavibacteria bacterium]
MARSKNTNGDRNKDEVNSGNKNTMIEKQLVEGKVPPHSLELEMNLLGGMIIDNTLIDHVLSFNITKSYFYKASNSEIYQAIIELHDRREPVDLTTLTEEMKLRGLLDSIGGPYYLAELTTSFTSAESVGYSSKRIVEYWLKRDLINITSSLRDKCFDPTTDTEELLNTAQREILDITNALQKKKYILLKDEVNSTMEYVESIHEKHASVIGVPSGYRALDEITGGFQKSELIIIAGRPSHGKTALALSIARNAAVTYQFPIGIFSIEMSNRELALRFLCAEAKVDIAELKTGRLGQAGFDKIATNLDKLTRASTVIIVDDSSPLGMLELRAKARRMKAEHDVAMIIVDYLQLMEDTGNRNIDRYLQIGYITRGLKQLAKELEIPVVALSQLSRKIEDRGGKEKRPMLSDLRESGSIEQDADVVIFINRPEVYMSKDDPKFVDYEGLSEIIVGKQRNGPTGEIKLTFIKSYARFEEYERREAPIYHTSQEAPF